MAVTDNRDPESQHPGKCLVPDTVAWGPSIKKSAAVKSHVESSWKIVAFGSSSTVGEGASRPQNGYVAQFGRALKPQTLDRIDIINAGVNGDTTADMLRRLHRDVLARKPNLVILQTGTNDALRQVRINQFRRDLARIIAELKVRSISVVLIDPQNVGDAVAIQKYDAYVSAIEEVAREENVMLLHRYRVMRYLALQHQGRMEELLANDRLHMNDEAHRCVGELLADGIGRMLR